MCAYVCVSVYECDREEGRAWRQAACGREHTSKLPDTCLLLLQLPSIPESSEDRCESTVNMVRKGHPAFPQMAKREATGVEIILLHETQPFIRWPGEDSGSLKGLHALSTRTLPPPPPSSWGDKRWQSAVIKLNQTWWEKRGAVGTTLSRRQAPSYLPDHPRPR